MFPPDSTAIFLFYFFFIILGRLTQCDGAGQTVSTSPFRSFYNWCFWSWITPQPNAKFVYSATQNYLRCLKGIIWFTRSKRFVHRIFLAGLGPWWIIGRILSPQIWLRFQMSPVPWCYLERHESRWWNHWYLRITLNFEHRPFILRKHNFMLLICL